MVAISVCERCKVGNHCYGSLNLPSIYPRPGGYMCVCKCPDSRKEAPTERCNIRAELHQDNNRGRILEIAFTGSESGDQPFRGAAIVEEEIARHAPKLLIINLLGFEPNFGNPLIGALVRASQAMNGAIRIAARGETAHKLQHAFAVMKLETLLDKRIFPDRESALVS